jgi:DNA-binding NarL/FixJ family response regulator
MKTLKAEVINKVNLTPRECEVLALLCEGQVDKAIARRLAISLYTVKDHLENLYSKLDVREASINARCAALASAVARGIVRISSTALCLCLMISFIAQDGQALRPPSARPLALRIKTRGRDA